MNALVIGDPLLRSLLRSDTADREQLIAQILVVHARPMVNAMLKMAVARPLSEDDFADIESEVILKLVRRLHLIAHGREDAVIGDFSSYVRTVVHHAIEDHRRRQQPERTRLSNRIRYVLTHDRRLAVWEQDGSVCGLNAWHGRAALQAVPPAAVEQIRMETTTASTVPVDALVALSSQRLRALVHRALATAAGPIAFEQLVDLLAKALQLVEESPLRASAERDSATASPSEQIASREHLARLWAEIVALPVRQRQALLLHLRFDDGESIAQELPALGLADVRGVAAMLELPLDTILELWNTLPLDDLRIAALLGLTRQQVINLRKSARERLARRLLRGGG